MLETNLYLFKIFYTLHSRTRYRKFSVYISLIFQKFKRNLSNISEIIFTESTLTWRCEPWGSWFDDDVDGTGSIAKPYTQQPDTPLLSGDIQQTGPVWREAHSVSNVSNENNLGTGSRAHSEIRHVYFMLFLHFNISKAQILKWCYTLLKH
jgi:hypothetical protein